jgi:heme exporter protein A
VTPLLRFDEVALRRGGRLLFDRLSFELGPGERLQVAGPNGSGKSSLLRLAAGLLAPAAGQIDRAPLALADDALALDRELPLRQALGFWGGNVETALDAVDLTPLADVPIRLLSSGQLKRGTLARVAASPARLWLLDEPLNALDFDGAKKLGRMVEAHLASGGAVLAASHQRLGGEWRKLELGG